MLNLASNIIAKNKLNIPETMKVNFLFSLAIQVMPLIFAIISIPMLINNLGVDRFGILSISWMFLGYFSLFDIGLGRATTKYVSEFLACGKYKEIITLVWTSWSLQLIFGVVGGGILLLLTPIFVTYVLKNTSRFTS